jgi:hypothetical protein
VSGVRSALTGWHLDVLRRLLGEDKPRDQRHWMRGSEADRARVRANGAKVIQR